MSVFLTDSDDPQSEHHLRAVPAGDCDCDCDCACPTDNTPTGIMPFGIPQHPLDLPVTYSLELTPFCNNRCPSCGNLYAADRSAAAAPMDGKQWIALIDSLATHAEQFRITGGESTLHPAFAAIIDRVAQLNIPFTLFTNARWPNPAKTLALLCSNPSLDGLLVSLHGPDAATHEQFSGIPGSYKEAVQNIRAAVAAGLHVAISMVINTSNWDRIAETLAVAQQLGVDHLVCNRLIEVTPGLTPDAGQLRSAIHQIESLRASGAPIRFGNCIPQCFEPSSSSGCTAGVSFATIDPWGNLRPCNHAPLIAGSLRVQPIDQIWHGPVMKGWRNLIPDGCKGCAVFSTCHGGCHAQALLLKQSQDPLIQNPPLSTAPTQPVEDLLLYAGLKPLAHFHPRTEGSRTYLVYKGRMVTVPDGYQAMIAHLDGSLTLRQIQGQWGNAALDFVGALYQKSMVELVSTNSV